MNIVNKVKTYIDFNCLFKALSAAVILLLIMNIVGFDSSYDNIRENVLRLHILANSDSREDQSLKLKVRDAVLAESEGIFKDCENEQTAKNAARQNLGKIEAAAQQTVIDNGYDYAVSAYICDMWFEDRVYDDFTLPAGMYEAIRVEIGKAEGKNWWCVMFPAVCLPSADSNDGLDSTLDDTEVDMCEEPDRYVAKFKVVELFERCRVTIKNLFQS